MKITRGDTQSYKFQRLDAEGNAITTKASAIYFTVKSNYRTTDVLFQKTIDDMIFDEDGTYHFDIRSEDTDGLKFGSYVYDIEVKIGNNYTKTISKGIFEVTEEVTHKDNEV